MDNIQPSTNTNAMMIRGATFSGGGNPAHTNWGESNILADRDNIYSKKITTHEMKNHITTLIQIENSPFEKHDFGLWQNEPILVLATVSTAASSLGEKNYNSAYETISKVDVQLRLPRKLLAESLQISRTTLYDLLSGHERDNRFNARIEEIKTAFDVIRSITKYPIGRSAHIVKLENSSLADTLKAEKIDLEKVAAITELIHKRKNKERIAERNVNAMDEQYLLTTTVG
jgi:hypothetical protein